MSVRDHGFEMSLIVSVSSGAAGDHTCALRNDGRAECWGRDSFGQLGNAYIEDISPNVVPVLTADETDRFGGMVLLSAGGNHTCALLSDDTGVCWGLNTSGQLGNSSSINATTPVPISTLTNAASITAGGAHTCARMIDGTARCWGSNSYGELGDATTTPRSAPVTVKNLLP
jgi:alpha-tubulin suppressor-like RCC1 family protein